MKKIYLAFALAGLLLSGCSDFLAEKSQSEVIPKTTADFSELLMGSGYPTKDEPSISVTSLMDDDAALFLTYNSGDPAYTDYHVENSITISNSLTYLWQHDMADVNGLGDAINTTPSATAWAGFYERILGCNAVLDYIDEAVGEQHERDRIKAEALAVRALLYWQLVNIYGEPYNHDKNAPGVPLRRTSELSEKGMSRSSVGEVYDVIVADLNEAARLMDPLDIVRKDFHINQPAIHILLSRVYLHMGEGYYDDCIAEVDKAIAQGARLIDMTDPVDLAPIKVSATTYNSISYNNPEVEWVFGSTPVVDFAQYRVGASPAIQSIWDDYTTDMRYEVFSLKPYPGQKNEVFLDKPKVASRLGQSIRTAEAILNRAEAYALSGEAGKASRDLNELCRNRIVGYSDRSLSGDALLDAIRLERRRELCFEGHRWFDLRRQGMPAIEHVYKNVKGGPELIYTLAQGDAMYTLPLPTTLLINNKELTQNQSAYAPERFPSAR